MAKVGEQLLAPEVGWKRVDAANSNIAVNKLTNYPDSSSFGGTIYSGIPSDSYAQFNFTGNKLRVIAYLSYDSTDNAHIDIDGKTYSYSYYHSSDLPSALAFEILNLQEGEHHCKLYSELSSDNRTYIWRLDAIDIDSAGTIISYNPIPTNISVPTNLTAIAGDSKVTLSWDAVTGATGYNVKRSTTAGGPYTIIATNVSGTSYVDATVTNGTTYYYVVTAVTADGESGNSNEASATPKAGSVTPPTPVGNALLRVTMNDSSEREYQLPTAEIEGFISWFNHYTSVDTKGYMLNKTFGKEYLAFDKIISFEVMELTK